MSRHSRRLCAALGLFAAMAISLSGCSGSALPALTDPTEIFTAGLKAAEGAKSVHVDITLDGSISADLSGTGGKAQTFPLTGTTASADVDIAGGKAHATFAVPAFLNLSGDLIQIGTTSYYKTSLSGPLYEQQNSADQLPVNPTDTAGIFDNIGDALSTDGVDPVKGDDVDCGGKKCYTVLIELTPAELAALGATKAVPSEVPVDLSAASLSFTIRVEKDTYRLAGIKTVASLGETGTLTLDITLSKWDQPMDISPPPADQIGTGS